MSSQGVTSIQDQLKQFKALVNQNKLDTALVQSSLFLLESGSNDIFSYFASFDPQTSSPDAYVRAMLTQVSRLIEEIYTLGARRIAVFSLGPVGCIPGRVLLPDAPVESCYGKMNVMAESYNKGLESIVNQVARKYPGAVAVYGDVYNIVQRFRAIPSHYDKIKRIRIKPNQL